MRCRECGFEVDNDKAFCPRCGCAMKITADYDYIQTEIANKVDRFFNEDENTENPEKKTEPETAEREREESQAKTKPITKTRPVIVNDSIYDDEEPYEDKRRSSQKEHSEREEQHKRTSGNRQRYIEYPIKPSQTGAKIATVLIIFLIIAGAAIGVMAVSGMFNSSDRQKNPENAKASLTTNIVAGETYDTPVTIVINKSEEGNVFYTLDGSEPSIDSKMYTEPFELDVKDVALTYPDVTLRAISFSQNSEKSGDLNISFHLYYDESAAAALVQQQTTTEPETQAVPDAPVINPVSGTYSEDVQILVSAQSGATIYYTYDGTIPDTRSNLYTGPVKMIPGASTFSAICVLDGVQSDYTSEHYNLEYNYSVSSTRAMNTVIDNLLWNGYIYDYDCNTNEGYAALSHKGVYTIDGLTYYVIQVDFYNSEGRVTDTVYRGVGVNYGGIYYMSKYEDSYYVNW